MAKLSLLIVLVGAAAGRNIGTDEFEKRIETEEGLLSVVQQLCPQNSAPALELDEHNQFKNPRPGLSIIHLGNFGNIFRLIDEKGGVSVFKRMAVTDMELLKYQLREINIGFKVSTTIGVRGDEVPATAFLTRVIECAHDYVDGQLVLYAQMPFYREGNLAEFLRKHKTQARFYFFNWKLPLIRKLLLGLELLHSNHYIHRDIKPENIMMQSEDHPVIIDFGFTKRVEKTGTVLGSPHFLSPELGKLMLRNLRGQAESQIEEEKPLYDNKVDVFSMGLVIFEIINNLGYTEADDLQSRPASHCAKNANVPGMPLDHERRIYCQYFAKLILRMTHENPEERPDIASVIKELDLVADAVLQEEQTYLGNLLTALYKDVFLALVGVDKKQKDRELAALDYFIAYAVESRQLLI